MQSIPFPWCGCSRSGEPDQATGPAFRQPATPTALVHELYIRLFAGEPKALEDREHLMAVAARQLRHVLVDYARQRRALKRAGGAANVLPGERTRVLDEGIVELHEALRELEQLDERVARAAVALQISAPTVRRDTRFARARLRNRLAGSG